MAMTQLLPRRSSVDINDRDPQLVAIDDASADELFTVLTSETARTLLTELYRKPATLSDVADEVDTSVQNATYHLRRLEEVGLVEAVDTWYSSRGREMNVYAPTSDPLVFIVGEVDGYQDTDDDETITEATPCGADSTAD